MAAILQPRRQSHHKPHADRARKVVGGELSRVPHLPRLDPRGESSPQKSAHRSETPSNEGYESPLIEIRRVLALPFLLGAAVSPACSGQDVPQVASAADASPAAPDDANAACPTDGHVAPAVPDAQVSGAEVASPADGGEPDTASPPDTGATDGTPPDAVAADAGAAPPSAPGCALPADIDLRTRILRTVPSSESDFTFDRAGNLVGVQFATTILWATSYQGSATMLAPAAVAGHGRGIRFLPGGDLLIVDASARAVVKIAPAQGDRSPLTTALDVPWGLAVNPRGFAYVAHVGSTGHVRRIPLAGGAATDLALDAKEGYAKGLTFGPDYGTLYFTTLKGRVAKVSISPEGRAGPSERVANTFEALGGGAALDGITSDECGNLFVVNTSIRSGG